jgi:signal transduction histidine kinase
MDFTPTDKNRYYYKLEGFDPDWAVLQYSQNFVQYTNLNPGEYTFKVKACNSDGTCSDKISSITIIIHPEWWQTNVFIGFVIVFILFAIVLYTRMRQLRLIRAKKKLEILVIKRTREILDQKQRIEQQNKELEKANRTKDKFLSVIGHDLRSPMTSIDQIIELILMRYNTVSEEEMRKFLELLQKTSASTLSLLDDLLLWAQSQSNQNILQKESLSVDNLLHELINSISLIAEKKRIIIEIPVNTGIKILADRNSILTILRNLLTNAIKFSHPDSTVKISVEEDDENVVFSVADKGIGIAANRVSKLFQFGSLTSKNGTSGETGTGFGLSLCKEFVELNGGKIWVESEEGKGSTFSFTVSKA